MREMALKGALEFYKGQVSGHTTNIEVLLEFGERTDNFIETLDTHLAQLAGAQAKLETLALFTET